jgi:ABC-type lipoprotein export system ATPase subunit
LLREAASVRGAAVFVVSHDTRLTPYANQFLKIEDGRLRASETAGLAREAVR